MMMARPVASDRKEGAVAIEEETLLNEDEAGSTEAAVSGAVAAEEAHKEIAVVRIREEAQQEVVVRQEVLRRVVTGVVRAEGHHPEADHLLVVPHVGAISRPRMSECSSRSAYSCSYVLDVF